ncbi:hypothetical protein N7493_007556 [Penicillium malachiteum]|uniref:Uncharacterized protein n=1 Tax=Penicillium malachiteum TaxID=1324776 RepID=A0AAD6HID2_9EURO|nr:hypothetical protein N7493_007556 [Penicillium malachiteum]
MLVYGENSYFHRLRENLPIPDVHLSYCKDLGDKVEIVMTAPMPSALHKKDMSDHSDGTEDPTAPFYPMDTNDTGLPPVSDLFVDEDMDAVFGGQDTIFPVGDYQAEDF